MNILVITRECWSSENSIGNTMSTLFDDLSKSHSIFNLYFRESKPHNNISKKTFRISERQLMNGLIHGKEKCGEYVENCNEFNKEESKVANSEKKIYDFSKKINSYFPNLIREFIWSIPVWKNDNLNSFLSSIKPDIVFMPVFPCWYAHKVLYYIKQRLPSIKIILFHADDCYSLKQFSLLPSFWIYRLIQRKWIRKSVSISDLNYVISSEQKEEYDSLFGFQSKILSKFYDFNNVIPKNKTSFSSIRFLFTGNLTLRRWKTLSLLTDAIQICNSQNNIKSYLDIYSATNLNKSKVNRITNDYCAFHGFTSSENVLLLQKQADILVHVEPFDKKFSSRVRLSFSTKIVDYLCSGSSVLAFGPSYVASISYFVSNNSAFVCTDKKKIYDTLNMIAEKPQLINTFAQKAVECGLKNHNKTIVLDSFKNDIQKLVE